ncbi:unnamed protein product [Didymodactylos carnosus]|uniref:Uncharacterized protein n=1 Tax=Didymodactylos carnosus TaxID=1234261 RepID=A0A815Q5M3_9BILA|nr:unnamed protein product [Didymodactylos carnosus]CAF4329955.1 unnamed protein product [Didymodactylos carnosus]
MYQISSSYGPVARGGLRRPSYLFLRQINAASIEPFLQKAAQCGIPLAGGIRTGCAFCSYVKSFGFRLVKIAGTVAAIAVAGVSVVMFG